MFVFRKTYFYFRKCPELSLGSILPDVTALNPDLVNYRISYFQIIPVPGFFFSGSKFYSESNDFVRYFACETLVRNIK